MGKILLCADTECLIRPSLMGLEDTGIAELEWLDASADALWIRGYVSSCDDIDEAWVVSSDDLIGINLAAAIKKDVPVLKVSLVLGEPSGSDISRARMAGINSVITPKEFLDKFKEEAARRSAPRGMHATSRGSVEESPEQIEQTKAAEAIATKAKKPEKRTINAFIMSVLSGSGGAGKSTVTAISAYLSCAKGLRTAVIDCDMQFGDIHQLMGSVPMLSVDALLAEPESVEALAADAAEGTPCLICAPDRLERSEVLASHLDEILSLCSANFDVVFVNTGASWAEYHAQLLERSACSVFLLDQRASSVRACQHALDLCMRLGIASGSFVYALNRCERGALFTSIDIANVMQGAQVFELKEGGSEVEELLGAGMAHELISSKNELCSSINAMLDELLPATKASGKRRRRQRRA